MQQFGATNMGRKLGGAVPLWRRRSWVPIEHNVARAETYLLAKFRLDPSNRLATVHERHIQTGQTDRQRTDSIGRTVFLNGRRIIISSRPAIKQFLSPLLLWPPYGIDRPLYFHPAVSSSSSIFFFLA